MKMLNKKILTTTLAASIVLGGGLAGLLQSKAFADETTTTTSTSTPNPTDTQKQFKGHKGGDFDKRGKAGLNITEEQVAGIMGITKDSLKLQMEDGKSLVDVAAGYGFTKESLIISIESLVSTQIAADVDSGKITSEQADQLKSKLTEKVERWVTGFHDEGGKGHGKGGDLGFHGNSDAVTSILGITKEEWKTAQQAGKSVADIAQEKGISEDDLISKLKDSLTDQLKKFVQSKHEVKQQPVATETPSTEDSSS